MVSSVDPREAPHQIRRLTTGYEAATICRRIEQMLCRVIVSTTHSTPLSVESELLSWEFTDAQDTTRLQNSGQHRRYDKLDYTYHL